MTRGIAAALCLIPAALAAQEPQGLARVALDHPAFAWVRQGAPYLRTYFLVDSYPAAHRDSLVRLAEAARRDNLALLGVEAFDDTIDVFFIERRDQMDALVGAPVTGFAHRAARAAFLVTNPDWRAFERHELMHVLAHHVWGPAAEAWIEEGLAQFADGRCGGYSVDAVAYALAQGGGSVPMDTLVERFRRLNDLTAYLQAASMAGYVYERHGRDALRAVWQRGAGALTEEAFAESWWRWVRDRAQPVPADALTTIRRKGCG
ncbi:MAG: hypothetical protein Q8Q14_03305 [Gemmatimonadales bacterium]|nr:hypothetical protein [Gemmatimonadales bacterium]